MHKKDYLGERETNWCTYETRRRKWIERERDKISNRNLYLDLNDSEPNLVDSKSRSDSDRDADFENEGDYLELKFSNLESDLESDSSGNAKLCYSYFLGKSETREKLEKNWFRTKSY